MAISAAAVYEIRPLGTSGNLNGGGFVTGATGVDYSQQNGAQYNLTAIASSGAGNTILSAAAASDMVGNIGHCISGTNFVAGWYEITSVVVGVSITFGTNQSGTSICSGIGASGVINIGGAMSMASILDDDFLEIMQAGNIIWAKAGTYVLGEAVSVSAAGSTTAPITIKGYNSTRGDAATGANRPLFAAGSNGLVMTAASWRFYDFRVTGTSATAFSLGNNAVLENCYCLNVSTTASRNSFGAGNTDVLMRNCEGISYRGRGASVSSTNCVIDGGAYHDSDLGIVVSNTTTNLSIIGALLAFNISGGINFASAITTRMVVRNCTIIGSLNKANSGTGINFVSGATDACVVNNIIWGFATGVSHADAASLGFDDYNTYYNNTANTSNWTLGPNSTTIVDPTFTSLSQVTGTAGKFSAANDRIIDTSKDFTSLGVVALQDYLYITGAGTGDTAGIYGISSITTTTNPNDTLVLDIAPGTDTTADKPYQITIGRVLSVGAPVRGTGSPNVFPSVFGTSYPDRGAIQHQDAGGSVSYVINQIVNQFNEQSI